VYSTVSGSTSCVVALEKLVLLITRRRKLLIGIHLLTPRKFYYKLITESKVLHKCSEIRKYQHVGKVMLLKFKLFINTYHNTTFNQLITS